MKSICTIIIASCIFSQAFAETYDWALGAGGVGEDRGFGIATDISGNVFTTGQFRSTATFGSINVTSAGVEDVFVVKHDPNGNVLWVFRGGGMSIDIGYDIVTDAQGNCYVAGTYKDKATFGSITLNSAGSADYDVFVLKLNSSGVVQWAKSAGGTAYDIGRGIAISNDMLFVSGNMQGTATFGSTSITGAGLYDIFVASYTLNGDVNWAAVAGGANYDISNGICADAAGNAYLNGYFQGTATFGSITITNPSTIYTNVFTAKINSSGSWIWARGGGTSNDDDIGRAIDCDAAGNCYSGGEFRGQATFDNIVVTSAGIADIFVAKYNTNGILQYVSTEGGQGGDYCYGVAANAINVFITGLFNGIVTFGSTSLTSAGINDIFIAELDATSGAYDWTQRAGGLGDDAGRAVTFNAGGFIAYTGDFEHNGSDFGPFILNSFGGHDIFVAKVEVVTCAAASVTIQAGGPATFCNSDSVLLTSTAANAVSYQWQLNGNAISGATNASFSATEEGDYTLEVSNACGDKVTSNLISVTVNNNPKATITPSGTINICDGDTLLLSANTGNGLSYQWTRNNNNISGATQSTLAVTKAGSYRVIVTKNSTGCSKTSKVTKVKITCRRALPTAPSVLVFPNPSATSFYLSDIGTASIEVRDASGRVVESKLISDASTFGEKLSAGIYSVRIVSNDGTVRVIKIVKL